MAAFVSWFERHAATLEGNWSDLMLKEGRPAKYADASGCVVPIPGAPIPEREDMISLLEAQTRVDFRFTLKNLHGENGLPRELDYAAMLGGLRFRCNLFHYMGGNLALVMRKLNAHVQEFPTLGLPMETVLPLFARKSGMILFSGATGSGKSTTMASGMVAQTHRPIHMLTIEDPIELLIPTDRVAEVTQREVGVDSVNFSTALRAGLREKPDIIMVGELRDAETIETAAIAANSGHLLMATTHARNASESIRRLLDSVPESSRPSLQNQLADSIIAIIAQVLVPRADGQGKVLAYEIMTSSSSVRANIRGGKYEKLPADIFQGRDDGMIQMESCLVDMVRNGVITQEAAMAATPDIDTLKQRLSY
jgi:twitching motility protein PilT